MLLKKQKTFLFLSFLFLNQFFQLFDPFQIKIENITLSFPNLPPVFKETKIVLLSDFHIREKKDAEDTILFLVSNLNPDYIFITGDIVDWTTKDLTVCRDFLKELANKFPEKIYVVFGNHDHKNKNFKELNNILFLCGIKVLNNEAVKLEKINKFIYLIGVDDPSTKRDNLELAMKNVPKNSFTILLAHSIDILKKAKEKNIDLILAGHFHGGQINIPYITDLFLTPKFGHYFRKYKAGLFKEDNTYFYISRGLGESVIRLRFNSQREITLITLK